MSRLDCLCKIKKNAACGDDDGGRRADGGGLTGISRTALVLILAFLLLAAWLTLQPIPAADTWWMLKSGEIIAQGGKIPPTDIFSYTARGLPWLNHEWLAGLKFFMIYQAGGMTLLYVFKSLAVILAFFIAFATAVKRAGGAVWAAALAGVVMLAVSGGRLYFDVRAYLFTYFLLSALLLVLELGYFRGRPRLLYVCVPLTLLWLNSHGGYILSYLLQAAFLGTALMDRLAGLAKGKSPALEAVRDFIGMRVAGPGGGACGAGGCRCPLFAGGITLLMSIGAGMLNPYGAEVYLYPFSFWRDSFYKRHLIEWIPPDHWGRNLGFTITVILVLVFFILLYRRLRLTDFIVLGAFSYLGLTVVRHSVLYSIAVLPVAGVIFSVAGEWLKKKAGGKNIPPARADRVIAALLLLITLAIAVPAYSRLTPGRLSFERELFPVGAARFIRMNGLPGRMYNPYEWGGYLIWKLYPSHPVFIDGRANTVYPESVYVDSILSMRGSPGWDKVMDRHQVNFILCNKVLRESNRHHLPDRLLDSPAWKLIYEDEVEMLFIRNVEGNGEIIEKAGQGKLILPRTPYLLNNEAVGLIRAGNRDGGRKLLEEALGQDPYHIMSLMNLASLDAMEKRNRDAIKKLRRVLVLNPGIPAAREMLRRLEKS